MIPSKEIEESNLNHNGLSNGGHIAYIYESEEKYIKNALNYIKEGLTNNQRIVFIDTVDNNKLIHKLLQSAKTISKEEIDGIEFIGVDYFYNSKQPLNQSLVRLTSIIDPYIENDIALRVWGNVKVTRLSEVLSYECECDDFLSKQKQIFTVCAYDGKALPASMLVDMLKVHEYFMTDDSLVPSNLYNVQPFSSPSIQEQIQLEKTADNYLMRSEQLTFAGQFSAGICHEIRNPLTTIKGFFQLLKEDNHNDKYYDVIEQELDRIQLITSELLLLAKPHSEQRERYNLVNLINEVHILLESQAIMKSITIETIFGTDDIYIDCDDTKIKQVIINIVKNAIEVMTNGTITIEVMKVNNKAVLTITDEGPGIPKELLQKIGQPFFTTKKEGTGLGLIISFNIIKNHGGTVNINSEEGEGTTFEITLPLVN